MIVDCSACSAQNFISAERLAVREIPPRCWECGRPLSVPDGETAVETAGIDPESNGSTHGKK